MNNNTRQQYKNTGTTRDITKQHRYNTVQHETILENASIKRDNMSTIRHNMSATQPNTNTKKARAAQIG